MDKEIFDGTRKLLNQHKVSIIGGDTTKGPMSISITLIGVQKIKFLLVLEQKLVMIYM